MYSASFQGVTFTFTEVDADTLGFEIKGTPTGDWSTEQYLDAFSLKNLGLDFSTVTGKANGPGAIDLLGQNKELNNSGGTADCSDNGGGNAVICFDIVPDTALGPTPFDLDYTIDFSAPYSIGDDFHLKIAFTATQDGDKVGTFYSQDIPRCIDGCGSTDGNPAVTDTQIAVTDIQTVPEPSTLLLLGSGLAVLARGLRKSDREGLGLS